MRKWVAWTATCVCAACFLLFTIGSTRTMQKSQIDQFSSHLESTGRLSALYLGNAVFLDSEETRADGFRALSEAIDCGLSLIDEDGKVVYDTRSSVRAGQNALRDEEVSLAFSQGEGLSSRKYSGKDYLFAAFALPQGGAVRVFAEKPTAGALYGGSTAPLTLLCILFLGVLLLWAVIVNHSCTRLTDGVASLMNAFAEGNFEARLPASLQGDGRLRKIEEAAGRIEDQLNRQKRRNMALAEVMNSTQSGLIAVDDKMNVILLTPAGKSLLGVMGAYESLPISEVSKDVNLEPVMREAMNQTGVYTTEVAIRSGGQRAHKPLRLYISAMKDGDKVVGAMALLEDVSELRRLEQMRTDFAANVSHELKTPLTSIKGFVETLQAGAINNPAMAEKFLNIINMETDRLTRLINDILSITKMESGKEEVSLSRLRLDKMATDVCEMLHFHAAEKKVTIHEPECAEPIYIWGNHDRVEQMLINLIENAVKYNKEGGSVTVSLFPGRENVQLLVSDTGIGIPEEHLPRLFERFYRVDKGRSRAMGGTGLGLAIVKHIVTSMNGLIEVHSKFGEGTEFLITLPRYYGEDKQAGEAKKEEE